MSKAKKIIRLSKKLKLLVLSVDREDIWTIKEVREDPSVEVLELAFDWLIRNGVEK